MTRLLIALFGAQAFGAIGLADDAARLRSRAQLGLRRLPRLALEAAVAAAVLRKAGSERSAAHCPQLPGAGYVELGGAAPVLWGLVLVALAECARTADGADGVRVCGICLAAMRWPLRCWKHGWLVPAGVAAGSTGRGTAGLSAVEFSARKAAAGQLRLPVSGWGAGLSAAVHRVCRVEHPAGSALLGRGRHGAFADPVPPHHRAAAVPGGSAAPLAGSPGRALVMVDDDCGVRSRMWPGACPGLCALRHRAGYWTKRGENELMATIRKKRKEPVSVFQRDPGPWSRLLINWLATLAVIMVFGLVMLFSASYTTGYLRMGDSFHYIKQQALCMLIGLGCMFAMSYVDHRFLRRMVVPGYLIVLAMLAVTLTMAPLNGCRRWIRFGGFTLQSSEVAKFEMILLCSSLAAKAPQVEKLSPGKMVIMNFREWLHVRVWKQLVIPVLPLIPVIALLALEPHMSGIVLTVAVVGTILLLSGSGGILTWVGAGTAGLMLETLLSHVDSIPYLQDRLDGWTQDLSKMTDQTVQSLYAIGSGGLTGLGLGNSVEKQLLVAPGDTNDIYLQQELGFVGAVLIIVLFVLFIAGCGSPTGPKTSTARWWASASWHRSPGRCSATSQWSPTPCPTPASACPSSRRAAPV